MELTFPSADPTLVHLDSAEAVLNRFHWNISVEHEAGEVRLRGGELLIAKFDTLEELEVFAAGMAIALSLLPETAVEAVDQFVGE